MKTILSFEEINRRVAEIDARKADPETAHALEDDLYREFVEYVASLLDLNPYHSLAQKAQCILQTQSIEFPRWTA